MSGLYTTETGGAQYLMVLSLDELHVLRDVLRENADALEEDPEVAGLASVKEKINTCRALVVRVEKAIKEYVL